MISIAWTTHALIWNLAVPCAVGLVGIGILAIIWEFIKQAIGKKAQQTSTE
jgi:hypothetical protein